MKTYSTCHTFNDIFFLVQLHTHDTSPPLIAGGCILMSGSASVVYVPSVVCVYVCVCVFVCLFVCVCVCVCVYVYVKASCELLHGAWCMAELGWHFVIVINLPSDHGTDVLTTWLKVWTTSQVASSLLHAGISHFYPKDWLHSHNKKLATSWSWHDCNKFHKVKLEEWGMITTLPSYHGTDMLSTWLKVCINTSIDTLATNVNLKRWG